MKPALFERNNHTIKDLVEKDRKVYESINAAKRASREKQIASDGGLGLGSMRVIKE